MKFPKLKIILPAVAAIALLTAWEQGSETDLVSGKARAAVLAELTAKEQIRARQAKLKNMGKAFKAISDQLRASSPDLAQIRSASASLRKESAGMVKWFPRGTGPEAGVKTDALPIIWKNKSDFNNKAVAMQDAAARLGTVARGGNLSAIAAQFKATGGKCKACHDKYRLDD